MSGQQGKIKDVARRSKAMDEEFRGPDIVNRARAERQIANQRLLGEGNANATTDWATSAISAGRYIPADPRDEEMKVRAELASSKRLRNMGKISAETVSWAKNKKQAEEYMRYLKFAEYLQDPKDPRTQDDMYSVVPELKEGPDRLHRENLVLQEQLRDLHQYGRIRGKEDLMLLIRICRKDFKLPIWPLWDPNGVLLNHFTEFQALVDTTNPNRGFFNPRMWAGGTPTREDDLQYRMKLLLLVRLLPGIRNASDPHAEAGRLMNELSILTDEAMDNSAANLGYTALTRDNGVDTDIYFDQ